MSVDPVREIFLGFIRLHILFHAQSEPVYGVGLMHELRRHGYDISPGTLYPTLHGLERAGYLHSEAGSWEGRRRRVYRTTKSGGQALRDGRRKAELLLDEIGEGRR